MDLALSFRAHMRGVFRGFASLIFPAPCRLCGRMLDTAQRVPFCEACIEGLEPTLPLPLCAQCGRPIVSQAVAEGGLIPMCHLCRRGVYDFDLARSFGAYTPAMARAVLMLKYGGVAPLGRWFARYLAEVVERDRESFAADVLVPVPQFPGRIRQRGYNHAELLARPLAKVLGIPLGHNILARTKARPDKLRLTRRERWESVRGAYAIHPRAHVDKLRVLLIDDVFTTGATLDACSRALRGAGAGSIMGVTVARALPSQQMMDVAVLSERGTNLRDEAR